MSNLVSILLMVGALILAVGLIVGFVILMVASKKFRGFIVGCLPTIVFYAINILVSFVYIFALMFIKGYKAASSGDMGSFNMLLTEFDTSIMDYIMPMTLVFQVIALIVLGLWYYFGFYKKTKADKVKFLTPKNILMFLLFTLGFMGLVEIFFWGVEALMPSAMEQYAEYIEDTGMGEFSVLEVISTIIMAPIVEEITLRGLTMRLFKKNDMKVFWIIFFESLFFGIIHGTPLQMIYAAGLGVLQGLIFVKFNSVGPCIFMHFLFNLFGGYLYSLMFAGVDSESWVFPVINIVLAVVCLPLAILLLRKVPERTDMPFRTKAAPAYAYAGGYAADAKTTEEIRSEDPYDNGQM